MSVETVKRRAAAFLAATDPCRPLAVTEPQVIVSDLLVHIARLEAAALALAEWQAIGEHRMRLLDAQDAEHGRLLADVLAVLDAQMAAPDGYHYARQVERIIGWEAAARRIRAKIVELADSAKAAP